MDAEETKIAVLIAAFDAEQAQLQSAITALNQTGAQLSQAVGVGAKSVVVCPPDWRDHCAARAVFYVHTDQLNAPRKVSRPSDNALVWRWDTDPFGTVAPNQNPAGVGTFVYNLRFPGQYYQAETGLYYNYYRDYDPQNGSYLESDPIGLAGGSFSTYAYVGGNPISRVDSLGLWSPGGHDALYANAFLGLLSQNDIEIIQQESRDLDSSTGIGTSTSYIHSMRAPGQRADVAKAASKKYVCDKLNQARNEPDPVQALKDFADAAHTITDYYSPEHTDANGNPRLWSLFLFHGHSPNDHTGHETVHDITPEIYAQTTADLINAYNQAFSGSGSSTCGCQ